MGYDKDTAVEVGVNWADDMDPFRHVKNHQYGHWANICNIRVFQSFEAPLGPSKFADLMAARKVGVMVRSFETNLKRPVKFPDQIIVANHITEVKGDRYFGVTTMWSVNQQAIVAEVRGWIVFFDFEKGKTVDLRERGGEYKALFDFLVERMEREKGLKELWERKMESKAKL